jgi:hypothetical protein
MGERNSGGDYEPAEENKPAEIGVFTSYLRDEHIARRVLAHEMIHHWENTVADNEASYYPDGIDLEISKCFSDRERERRWRSGHSKRFISKAYSVADSLGILARVLLFGRT